MARVLFCFSRGDCEGDSEWARGCRALLAANPSSQAPHKKKPGAYKYDSFIALDLERVKVLADPGLAIPADLNRCGKPRGLQGGRMPLFCSGIGQRISLGGCREIIPQSSGPAAADAELVMTCRTAARAYWRGGLLQ